MRRWVVTAALACSAAAWIACSSFGDGPPASDGPDASTTIDAEDPTREASSVDGDAGSDGACNAFFCDGFERTQNVANGWNAPPTSAAGQLTLSTSHPRKGTGSLQLELFADASTGPRTAYLVKDLPPAATKTVVDFWVHYDDAPSTDTTVAAVGLHTLDGNIIVLLSSKGIFVINEQRRPDGGGALLNETPLPVGVVNNGQPRHVTLEIGTTLANGGPGAKLTVDGVSASRVLVNQDPRPARVYVGSTFSAAGTRNQDLFWYDDLVIEATPR